MSEASAKRILSGPLGIAVARFGTPLALGMATAQRNLVYRDDLVLWLDAVARLEYPNFECIVIINNTPDPALWQPLTV